MLLSPRSSNLVLPHRPLRLLAGAAIAAAIAALVALVLLAILATAAGEPSRQSRVDVWHLVVMTSIQAGLTTILSLLVGTALAWALNRLRFPGRDLVVGLFASAIVTPGLIVAFGLLASGVRIGWPRALFVLFALHLYLTHQRFSYVFFLLVPLVLAPDIAEQFPGLSAQGWVREKRDGLERLVLRCRQYLPGAMAAALIGGFVLFATGSRIEPGQKTSAKSALAFAAERGLSGPVLNSYDFGGTLIFHGIKTFIDGRTDQLFLGGFTQADEDMGTSAGKPLIEALLGKYAIDWALLSSNDKRIPFFDELPDWKRVYADPYAVIYVRD